jgi:hypothetical protein
MFRLQRLIPKGVIARESGRSSIHRPLICAARLDLWAVDSGCSAFAEQDRHGIEVSAQLPRPEA